MEEKIKHAYNEWLSEGNVPANMIAEKYGIHPKYIWQEMARQTAQKSQSSL